MLSSCPHQAACQSGVSSFPIPLSLHFLQLLPADGVETPRAPNLRIWAHVVIARLAGRIGERVFGRSEFPYILHDTPYLRPVRPAACAVQQKEHVVDAEGESVRFHAVHDFKAGFRHLHFRPVAVAPYNPDQGLRVDEFGTEPHAALFFRGERAVLEKIEEGGYFLLYPLQEVRVILFYPPHLPHPIACLSCVDYDGQTFVVGA